MNTNKEYIKGKEILFDFWQEYTAEKDGDKRDEIIEKYSMRIEEATKKSKKEGYDLGYNHGFSKKKPEKV